LDIKDFLKNFFRPGEVVETDPEKCMVRVKFPDADELVSHWLQVVQLQTYDNQHYYMPDIDEIVLCFYLGYDPITGIAGYTFGSVFNEKDQPPESGQDIYYTIYKDGTRLKYDRKKHLVTKNIKGDVLITVENNESTKGTVDVTVKDFIKIENTGDITVKTSKNIKVEATGNVEVKCTGNMTVESTGNMDINSTGNMTLSPTAIFKLNKMTPAAPAQGPLNCIPICPLGPPHGGNTVA
jgi:phage baseplate assembly protein V